jgi:hypothetical protein
VDAVREQPNATYHGNRQQPSNENAIARSIDALPVASRKAAHRRLGVDRRPPIG